MIKVMEVIGLQWNIQAARVRNPEADPLALDSYIGDRPEYIGGYLAARALDFITLQEVHANGRRNQAEEIASYLDGAHVVTDSYGQSFMNPDYDICQAVISKHPKFQGLALESSFYVLISYLLIPFLS